MSMRYYTRAQVAGELEEDECDRLEHRIIFWPDGELTIPFRELTLSREPREDRRCYLGGAFQIVYPEEDGDSGPE